MYGIVAFAVGLSGILIWLHHDQQKRVRDPSETTGPGPLEAKELLVISVAVVVMMVVSLLRIGAFGI